MYKEITGRINWKDKKSLGNINRYNIGSWITTLCMESIAIFVYIIVAIC